MARRPPAREWITHEIAKVRYGVTWTRQLHDWRRRGLVRARYAKERWWFVDEDVAAALAAEPFARGGCRATGPASEPPKDSGYSIPSNPSSARRRWFSPG